MSRIPGRNNAARVTTPPSRPAHTRVALAPSAEAIGPVTAKETGTSPIEMNQSNLETRPRSWPGTRRCFTVAHTTVPAVSRALTRTAHSPAHPHLAAGDSAPVRRADHRRG